MYTGLTGRVSFFEKTSAPDETPITYGERSIAYINNWSVEDTADIIEFAQLGGDGYKITQPGQQSWSASADGAVSFLSSDYQAKLFEAKSAREEVKLRFYLSTADNTYFEGYGFIESLSVDLSAEDKGNISISISGNSHTENDTEYGLRLYRNGTAV